MERKKDIIVVGGGPAGYVAAIRAAQLGAKVLLVEKDELGGTCVHRGCIPTKSWLKSVEVLETARKAKRYGVKVSDVGFDFKGMIDYSAMVVRTVVSGLHGLMKSNGVKTLVGTAQLKSATEVEVTVGDDTSAFEAGCLVVATGASPALPPVEGITGSGIITSDEVFKLTEVPESLAVIGAGAVGVELANVFSLLGTKVSLIEMLPHVMPAEDEEIGQLLERPLKRTGIKIYTSAGVERIEDEADSGSKVLVLKTPKGEERVLARMVLVATGRRPNLAGLGLEGLGVKMEKGAIVVSSTMETSVSGVYAAGDVVGGIMLAHVASAEAEVAVENGLGGRATMDYRVIPRCVYTMPEVGSVGLTEKQAREAGHEVKVGRFPFSANSKALILGERDGVVKIVADAPSGTVLGIHILGPHATELVAQATTIVGEKGTLGDIGSLVHAHPTLHEAVREAALDAEGKAIHIPRHG